MRPKVARSLALLIAVLACALPAVAATPSHPGALDRSFSGNGFTLMDFGTEPWRGWGTEVASLPGGRFLVLVNTHRGDSVMRFEADGSVDRSFGNGGVRLLDHPVSAMELAPGGKIVVAGYANLSADEVSADFAVTRLTPDGRLDRGFGRDGSVVFGGRPGGDGASSVLVRPDGRIVVLGRIIDHPVWSIEVAELDPSGRLVPGFGRGGVAVVPVPPENVSMMISRIEPQGARTIVLLGHPGAGQGGLLRLNPDGTKDPTFGIDGEVTSRQIDAIGGFSSRYYSSSAPAGLAVAADGSIMITTENAKVTRLLPGGAPDPGFGQGGQAQLGALEIEGAYAIRPYMASFDAEGRVLLAGRAELGSDPETRISALLTARLQPDGAPDPTFGGDGFAITPVEGEGSSYDLALLPGGEALAVGGSGSRYGFGRWVMAARYAADGKLDPGFGAAGIARTPAFVPAADEAAALLVDRRGRTFAAGAAGGKAALLSLRPGGRLDTGFGKRGMVTPTIEPDDFFPERVGALARYPGGRLLAGVGSKSSGAVLRYRADGSLDSSFGGDGVARASCLEMIQSLAVLPDGRILVAGRDYGPFKVALTRLLPGGAPDPGFGGEDGCVYSGYFGPWGGQPSITVRVLPGGGILLGGHAGGFFFNRYSAGGFRDRKFQTSAFDGVDLYPARVLDFAVDRAGRIVVAGLARKEGRMRRKRALLVRLLPSGRVDRSFSRDGALVLDLSRFTTFHAVRLEPGGRIVAGGTMSRLCGTLRTCPSRIFVARFEPDGTRDRSFGRDGIWRRQFEDGSRLTSLALGPGTITVGGWSRERPADSRLLVARLRR